MSNADYVGRTIDIMAINTADGRLFDSTSTGRVVTGIYKLAQRALITLLTETGTTKYDFRSLESVLGCDFMTDLRMGYLRTEADVFGSFALAELQVRSQLQAEESGDEPDDERYNMMELSTLLLQQGTATMTVKLYSQSDSVEVIIPISTVP
jgi:hypothetical protein